MIKVDVGWGQGGCKNFIKNTNLELIDLSNPIFPPSGGQASFERDWVKHWYSSHNNPHHFQINPLSTSSLAPCDPHWTTQNGSEIMCFVQNEGLFQNISLPTDPYLVFNFSCISQGIQCGNFGLGGTFNVVLTQGLIPSTIANPITTQPLNSFQSIVSNVQYSNANPTTVSGSFSSNQIGANNQIWIYKTSGTASNLSEVSLTCTTNALSDIIVTKKQNFEYKFETQNLSSVSTFQSFDWTVTDRSNNLIVFTSTLEKPIFIFNSGGEYTVCVDIIDNNGCCASRCENISIPNCTKDENCINIGKPGETILLSTLLAGPNPVIPHTTLYFAPIIDGLCFNLEGTLIVDVWGTAFRNTTWYCGPGAGIRINSLGGFWSSVSILESRFVGCSTMWRGIFFQPNPLGNFFVGGLTLRNSQIYDAYRGIELASGTLINATGSSFIDNYVGGYIPENGFNAFTDCRFENTGNMKPAYLGQPSWNARMYAGIEAVDGGYARVFGNEANSRSLFKNLSYGIKTFKGGFVAQNTKFEVSDAIAGNDYQSYGIYEEKTSEFSLATYNTFTNNLSSCYYSTGGDMHGIQLSNNVFNLSSTFKSGNGISILSSKNGNIEINNTNIFRVDDSGGRAINLNNCQYQNLKIDENEFFAEKETGAQDIFRIQSCTPLGGEGLVRENKFYFKKKRDIYITSSPKIVFLKNEFFDDSGRILISSSNNVFVKGNINSNTAKSTWLQVSNSKDAKICCNESNAPYYSAISYGGGGNVNNKIIGNQINNLTFYDQTIFGAQPSHGNIFDPSGSAAVALNFQPDLQYYIDNQFTVDPNQVGYRPLTIDVPAFIGVFFDHLGRVQHVELSDHAILMPLRYLL
jgi:hypothetical protein